MPQELVALLKVVYIYSSKFQLTVWSHELCQGKKNDRHLGIYDPLTKLKKITKQQLVPLKLEMSHVIQQPTEVF